MALSNLQTVTNYEALRYAILELLEGNEPKPYYDTAKGVHPTVGIGFNLDVGTVRDRVFDAMQITDPTIIAGLEAVIASIELRNLPAAERDSLLQQSLDAYLNATMGRSFEMTPIEIATVFAQEADEREGKISGVESNSLEMIALLSAQYNGVYGTGLKTAISQDNRAEAWYELRYNSNGGATRNGSRVSVFRLIRYRDQWNVQTALARCGDTGRVFRIGSMHYG